MRDTTRPDGGTTNRRKGGSMSCFAALLIVLSTIVASVLSSGCSSEKRYKVLSFFFDGVPDPNAPAVATGDQDEFGGQRAGNGSGAAKPVAFMHKPYGDNQCSACHENARGNFDDFQKLSSDVCLKCHDKVRDEFPVMHGPVAAAECNLCHVPHESSIPHLLRDAAPTVCVQCHQPELLSPTPREHLLPDKSCLDCHTGHGSDKHGLLKPNIALMTWPSGNGSPTTAPFS